MGQFFVGVDLGQVHDATAIAVVERAELRGAWDPVLYAYRKNIELHLRYLERMELGTPYPAVADRVAVLAQSGQLAGRCTLVVDGTGVGRPVVDLIREARPGCELWATTITGGDQETRNGSYYGVPKRELITGLHVALQCGRLKIAQGLKHGATLLAEMADMRVRVTGSGKEQFGAWREGTHDDLVFAVALACWGIHKRYPWPLQGRAAYWTVGPDTEFVERLMA